MNFYLLKYLFTSRPQMSMFLSRVEYSVVYHIQANVLNQTQEMISVALQAKKTFQLRLLKPYISWDLLTVCKYRNIQFQCWHYSQLFCRNSLILTLMAISCFICSKWWSPHTNEYSGINRRCRCWEKGEELPWGASFKCANVGRDKYTDSSSGRTIQH